MRASRNFSVLAASVALGAAALAGAPPAMAAWHVQFGPNFYGSRGFDSDAAGNVYVGVDSFPNVVKKFSPGGELIDEWEVPKYHASASQYLTDIAVAPHGDVYTTEHSHGDVWRFSASGELKDQFGAEGVYGECLSGRNHTPTALDVDAAGNVFVVSPSDDCIRVFDDNGDHVASFGTAGTGEGQFNLPHGVAVEGSPATGGTRVLVTDGQSRVQEFTFDGATFAFVRQWGDPSSPPGFDSYTPDVVIDGSDVFVGYLGGGCGYRLERRSATGELLGHGCGPGLWVRHLHAHDGQVYVPEGNFMWRIDTTRPTASLEASKTLAVTGEPIQLDASKSAQPLRSIQKFEWDIDGDGTYERDTGTTPSTEANYSSRGTRQVRLRVVGEGGKTATASVSLDIRQAPPPGAVGMTINGGATYTNDPVVVLSPVWPAFATTLTASNDGGFANAQSFPVEAGIPWGLESAGDERLPKTVYVRFDDSTQTFQDDIILDQRPPAVEQAAAKPAAGGGGRYTLSLDASDTVSGVDQMQFAARADAPGDPRPFESTIALARDAVPALVRVRDNAGNFSEWKRVALTAASLRAKRVRRGKPIRVVYTAPAAGRLGVKLIRGKRLVRRRGFEVDEGRGTASVSSRRLKTGRYKVRVTLAGTTIDLPLRIIKR